MNELDKKMDEIEHEIEKPFINYAKEISQNKIKTEEGFKSLVDDIKDLDYINPQCLKNKNESCIYKEYIIFNIYKGFYDKDPNCDERLSFKDLETIVFELKVEFDKSKLFNLSINESMRKYNEIDIEIIEKYLIDNKVIKKYKMEHFLNN
jgi:hypothetical protein